MIPLSRPVITEQMKKHMLEVLDSGRLVKGPKVEEFENLFAKYCNVKQATAVSSGTAAIYLALRALNIGPGDEVACPSFTFIATASPILLVGAMPVFVDVGDDYSLDLNDLEGKLSSKTKAVIAVHLYGLMGDMGRLIDLKRKCGFFLIEDACQAHGAEYDGMKSGSFGDISCFSFYPSKNMTVAGEGGMVLTEDEELDAKLKVLRDQGVVADQGPGKYISRLLGFNFRMAEISAALGIAQLNQLDEWIETRRNIATQYHTGLPEGVIRPLEYAGRRHVYNLYVIRTQRRDELSSSLWHDGIETGIHYLTPVHRQPIFSGEWHLPKTEEFTCQVLSLPMYPTLKTGEVEYVCQRIRHFLKRDRER